MGVIKRMTDKIAVAVGARPENLSKWQERLAQNKAKFAGELAAINRRDAIYNGTTVINDSKGRRTEKEANNVYNIAYELIEGQVDSSIPMPRVKACVEEDVGLAERIEDMLRAKLDQLPFEELNDIDERNTYNQGGDLMLVEWDSTTGTHTSIGDLAVSVVHPMQIIPQDGVCDIDAMDYFFVRTATTCKAVKSRYGVDVKNDFEEDASIRGEDAAVADGLLTVNTAYYHNDHGGIGRYVWANDTELEDMEDYQARNLERCVKCGATKAGEAKECRECGGKKWKKATEDYETLTTPLHLSDGTVIPVESPVLDEDGNPVMEMVINPDGSPQLDDWGQIISLPKTEPTRIPYYKPDVYPLILRRNVSKHGTLLGSSDIDVIAPQQEAVKKVLSNVMEKVLKGGSYVTLPKGVNIELDGEQMNIIRVENPAEKALIDVVNIQPNITFDMQVLYDQYDKAKSVLGITSSFQGKPDSTATSGIAKQFSAAQAAGRLESKRRMKNAFYQRLFQLMFRFMLAYADEPMKFRATSETGKEIYTTFNRYDFLKRDAAGELYWNDEFLFSVDTAGGMAQNREAMWAEAEKKYTTGAMGDPSTHEARMMYWSLLEQLQFPMAKSVKRTLEEEQARQEEQAQQAMQAQQMEQPPQGMEMAGGEEPQIPEDLQQLLQGGGGNVMPGM